MTEPTEKKPKVKATKQKALQLTPKAIDVLNQLVAESGMDQSVVVSTLLIGWEASFRKQYVK